MFSVLGRRYLVTNVSISGCGTEAMHLVLVGLLPIGEFVPLCGHRSVGEPDAQERRVIPALRGFIAHRSPHRGVAVCFMICEVLPLQWL